MEVERFMEYLRIRTEQPRPDYQSCLEWLKRQAEDIGLVFRVHRNEINGKPCIVLSVPPDRLVIDPNGKIPPGSILLNSHMDVVPADPEKWVLGRGAPFDPIITDDGKIVGRGTQDMKCVGFM
jgi:aminoacylase